MSGAPRPLGSVVSVALSAVVPALVAACGAAPIRGAPSLAQPGEQGGAESDPPVAAARGGGRDAAWVPSPSAAPGEAAGVCSRGYCWVAPSPQGNHLFAVHGSGPADVWAVGAQGTAVHFDGRRWSIVETPTTEPLHAVWVAGPTLAWAVGARATLLRWDGRAWAREAVPGLEARPELVAVHGLAADDVWVGGTGLLLHWDGRAWTRVASPPGDTWTRIASRAAGDVWFAGRGWDRAVSNWRPRLARWDGTRVTAEDPPPDTGSGAGLVTGFAFDGGGVLYALAGGMPALHVRAPGASAWVADPHFAPSRNLHTLVADADGTLWAAGRGVLAVRQGDAWEDRGRIEAEQPFEGLFVAGHAAAFAVGSWGLTARYDGRALAREARTPPWRIARIAADRRGRLWAAGEGGELAWRDGDVWHALPPFADHFGVAHLWPRDEREVWVAARAERDCGMSPENSAIYRWDGARWTLVRELGGHAILAMAASPDGAPWFVVGESAFPPPEGRRPRRFVLRFEGGTPRELAVPAAFEAQDLEVLSEDDAWVAGGTRAFHWDGRRWSAHELPGSAYTHVWAEGPRRVWFAGHAGRVVLWDGRSFALSILPPGDEGDREALALEGSAGLGPWVADAGGRVRRWDGAAWRDERVPLEFGVHGLALAGRELWVRGSAGELLRRALPVR